MRNSTTSESLNVAKTHYYAEKDLLEGFLEEKNYEQIKGSLTRLVDYLIDVYDESKNDFQWQSDNVEAYMSERRYLGTTWASLFPGTGVLDGRTIMPIHIDFQPAPVGPPPPIGEPIVTVPPAGALSTTVRVLLGLGGIALISSGFGTLAVAGLRIAASLAAQQAAKQITIIGFSYGAVAVVTIYGGKKMTQKALKSSSPFPGGGGPLV